MVDRPGIQIPLRESGGHSNFSPNSFLKSKCCEEEFKFLFLEKSVWSRLWLTVCDCQSVLVIQRCNISSNCTDGSAVGIVFTTLAFDMLTGRPQGNNGKSDRTIRQRVLYLASNLKYFSLSNLIQNGSGGRFNNVRPEAQRTTIKLRCGIGNATQECFRLDQH